MSIVAWRRSSSTMGIVGMILISVALLLPGEPPRTSDPAETLRQLLMTRRGAFLAGQYVAGVGAFAVLWFIPTLRRFLAGRDDRADDLATASALGMLLGLMLVLAGMAPFTGVALKGATLDAAMVRVAIDTGNELLGSSKFAFAAALITGSLAAARSGSMPRWLTRSGVAAGAFVIVSAASIFSADTRLEFGSPFDLAGAALPFGWLLAVAVVVLRRSAGEVSDSGADAAPREDVPT